MVARYFYTLVLLVSTPASLILIFKPQLLQNLYNRIYIDRVQTKDGTMWKSLAKSFLAFSDSELGILLHRGAGILLAIFSAYILLNKFPAFAANF